MRKKRDELLIAYENLFRVKDKCACEISEECSLSSLTVKQLEYLKVIDRHNGVTFSMLASITKNSKPTITEMINKFLSLKCVYKERCPTDRRVSYIHLTERAKEVARHEEMVLQKLVNKVMRSLSADEIDILVKILKKVK